jgi:BA14K-like protein
MTVKAATCAMAIALLAGTASFTVPAAAQGATMPPSHAKTSSIKAKRLFLSTVAVYDAGLRRGRASSANRAYLRGFRDGTSSEAYASRAYVSQADVVSPYASNPVRSAVGSSLYDSYTGYVPLTSGYSSYGTRSVSYGDGYASDRYDQGYVPPRLMDVAVAPVAMPLRLEARAAHLSYCSTRYQSFDLASDTFLATDGNRYYCR